MIYKKSGEVYFLGSLENTILPKCVKFQKFIYSHSL